MKNIGRIKFVKTEGDDILNWTCICPHCGKEVKYGEMMKTSGINNCPNCNDEVNKQIAFDKKTNYEVYVRKAINNEYEPYMYRGE